MYRFLLLCFACVGMVSAQESINVTVSLQPKQEPVSNLEIQLINESRGISIIKTSDKNGNVKFTSLPVIDDYQIKFAGNDDYLSSQSGLIDLRSNENVTINLPVFKKIGKQALDEVIVTDRKTLKINRRNAEVSFELQAEELKKLPVEARDINTALFRLPNVTQATGFFPEAPPVSINGANSLYTNYTIDGMDNNEQFLGGMRFNIPVGIVKDITVLTSNYSAEYGLSNNGVIDITTKSGTNDIKGEIYAINRPGQPLDASSPFAQRDLSGNQVKDGFERYQTGMAIGGPIKKDQTFFFFNFEHTTDLKDNLLNSPDLGVNETVQGTNTFNYFSAKIDHNWAENFRSSLRANFGLVNIDRQGGGLSGGVQFPSAANQQQRNSLNLALKNNYEIGDLTFESNLQYSRFKWDYADPNSGASPQATLRNPQDLTVAVIGHPGFVFDAEADTYQFQQKVNYAIDDHSLKAGFNYLSSDHSLFGGGNPNGNYVVDLTQDQLDNLSNANLGSGLTISDLPEDVEVINYNVELRPTSFGTTQNIYSFYLEDLWAVTNKLDLKMGLRYDYDNLSKGGGDDGDFNNLAPRFNFNYELTDNSVIRGGYGIAYDKILYSVYSDALQQSTDSDAFKSQLAALQDQGILNPNADLDQITFNGNLTATIPDADFPNGPIANELSVDKNQIFSNERRILNPNGYDNPYTHQISLGYQTKIDDDKLFFVDLFHNRGENLYRLRNLNAAEEFPIDADFTPDQVRTQAEADATRPIPIVNGAGIINGQEVQGVARNVIMTETKGQSRYYAASFNLQKQRGDDKYSYRLNYTLSSLRNNTEDINFRAMDANNYENEWGPSINDRRHNINGIFNWFPVENSLITFAGLLQSGQPINRIPDAEIYGTTDLNGDGSGFGEAYVGNSDRSPGESRNNDRLPWSFNFDVHLQYSFDFMGDNQLELSADVFNVFNVENLSGFPNNATQSNQIQAGSASSGRFVQRNAGPPRQFQFGARYLF